MTNRKLLALTAIGLSSFILAGCFAVSSADQSEPPSIGLAGQSVSINSQQDNLRATQQALNVRIAEATAQVQAQVDAQGRSIMATQQAQALIFTSTVQALNLQATAIALQEKSAIVKATATALAIESQVSLSATQQAALIQQTNTMVQATQTAQDLHDSIDQSNYNNGVGRLAIGFLVAAGVLAAIIGLAILLRHLNTKTTTFWDKDRGWLKLRYNRWGELQGAEILLLAAPTSRLSEPQEFFTPPAADSAAETPKAEVVSHQGQNFSGALPTTPSGVLIRNLGRETFYADDPAELAERQKKFIERKHVVALLSAAMRAKGKRNKLPYQWTENSDTIPGFRWLPNYTSKKWSDWIEPLQRAGYVISQPGQGEDGGNHLVGEHDTLIKLFRHIRDNGL